MTVTAEPLAGQTILLAVVDVETVCCFGKTVAAIVSCNNHVHTQISVWLFKYMRVGPLYVHCLVFIKPNEQKKKLVIIFYTQQSCDLHCYSALFTCNV